MYFKVGGGVAVGAFFTFLGNLMRVKYKQRDVTVAPQPLVVGKSAEDRLHDANHNAHESLFMRMSSVEKTVAKLETKTDMMIDLLKENLKK